MREPRFWLYKWNASGKKGRRFTGVWLDCLKQPFLTTIFACYGFDNPNPKMAALYDEVKIGDVMFCYQVDSKSAVGFCIVAGKGVDTQGRLLTVTAAHRFASPVDLAKPKGKQRDLGRVRALESRLPCSLFELSAEEAEILLGACGPGMRGTVDRTLEEFWKKLVEGKWTSQLPRNDSEMGSEDAAYVGAGYGDPSRNKEVEVAAIRHVSNLLGREGWQVASVEADKVGFDLLCVRPDAERHVEVKGIGGAMVGFIITHNELWRSRTDPNFVLYAVTDALSTEPKEHAYSGSELEGAFGFRPLQFFAKLKKTAGCVVRRRNENTV